MLPASSRMRNGDEFATTVRRGRRAGRRTLVVHLKAPASAWTGPAKVGFVVSKAVGSAVVRNRVKRRLRHLTRERLNRLPAGALVVVRANPAAADPAGSLAADLDSALAALQRRPGSSS